jgi:hypothetical protein
MSKTNIDTVDFTIISYYIGSFTSLVVGLYVFFVFPFFPSLFYNKVCNKFWEQKLRRQGKYKECVKNLSKNEK